MALLKLLKTTENMSSAEALLVPFNRCERTTQYSLNRTSVIVSGIWLLDLERNCVNAN